MKLRALVVAVLSCMATLGLGSAQANIFGGNPPNYLSGTGCRVWGSAVISGSPTTGFVEGKIVVEGTVVKHWVSNEPALQHITLSAVIDSTHFAHDSVVAVSFLAKGDDNVWYTSSIVYLPVYNVAGVFGRNDIEVEHIAWQSINGGPGEWIHGNSSWEGCPTAADKFLAMNHFIYGDGPRTELGWDWEDLASAIQGSTTLYVNTHGGTVYPWNAVYFLSDSDDGSYYYPNPYAPQSPQAEEFIVGSSVYQQPKKILPVREAANGTGLPPYNTGNPPINFAWIDGCKSGYQNLPEINNTFPEALLHPIDNAYHPTPIPENQAFCGYLVDTTINRTSDTVAALLGALEDGWTVHQARLTAYYEYVQGSVPRDWEPLARDWMAVYGDWATRVHGVYTGLLDGTPVTGWYR